MKAVKSIVAVIILVGGIMPVVFLPSYASIIVTPVNVESSPSENRFDKERTDDYWVQELFLLLLKEANLPFTAELLLVSAPFMYGSVGGGCVVDGELQKATVHLSTATQSPDVVKFILAHEIGHLQQRVLLPECRNVASGTSVELDADVKAVMLLNIIGFDGATIARNALIAMCSQKGEGWRVICDGSGGHPSLEDRMMVVSTTN